MKNTTTSIPDGPFGDHIRLLVDFLTVDCGMNPGCANHCLKAFLVAKAADNQFLQTAPKEASTLAVFLKSTLRDFAGSWLTERQLTLDTASRDLLGFPRTMWTMVRIAGAPEDEIRLRALEILLQKYLPALRAYLVASAKRRFGVSEEWIDDCLQSFINEKVLQKQFISKVNRERGRFRDLLKTSVNNFAISVLRREQPWRFETLDDHQETPAHSVPPAETPVSDADVEWVRRIVVDALRRMMSQCLRKNQHVTRTVFERRRLMPLLQDRKPESLEETAKFILDTLHETVPIKKISEQQILGDKKFRRFVDDVLSEYCRDAAEIEDERQRLMDILQHDLNRGGGAAIEKELQKLMETLWQSILQPKSKSS